jgi:hypothetical protein
LTPVYVGQKAIAEYPVWICDANGSTKLPEKTDFERPWNDESQNDGI